MKKKKSLLSLALSLCMMLSLLPTTALAAAPATPTNLRIQVGDLYQTLPVLIWDKVEGATTYDINATDVNGNWVQTNGTTLNHVSLGYYTQAAVGYQVIANNENDEKSEPATLEGISVTVNSSTSPTAAAIHNTAIYDETEYHLYTITGLPENATCRLEYKFYDPAKNDNISYADNTKNEWEKKYTFGSQPYEINANGVLVIGMDAPTPNNGNDDWNGLCDGVVNPACDEYSLTVTSSSSIAADGKTVTITQQEIKLSFAEYSGQTTSTQSVSFAQSRVDNIEFGTPYTQTATHTTGDGSLVYYSMYAAIKKVNPTSGEVVGWRRNKYDDSARITAYAAATANYPATLAIYSIFFVDLSNAPKNIHLAFETGNTNPGLQWTPSEGTWTGFKGEFFDEDGKSIHTSSSSISGSASIFSSIQRASFGKTGAQAETLNFKKAEIKLTGTGDDSATGTIDINFTSTQTVSATPLTAVFSGTSAEGDYGNCAHFTVSSVPASKSMEVIYRYPTGTEYDGTMTTNTCQLSGSDGSYSFFDPVSSNSDGVLSLNDSEIDTGDYYYLAVYDGTVTNDTTGSVNITLYPLEFIFDSRLAQELSWNTSGTVSKTYGDAPFTNLVTNASVGGSTAITYASSNTDVATVDANGQVTIKAAGEATITATADATGTAPDGYRATSISYTLSVAKKAITVTADNQSKVYGAANPALLTFTHAPSDLVSGDDTEDLGVTLSCTATTSSPAGTPVAITGTSSSTNYNVTVTPGELTITKADQTQPTLSLSFSTAVKTLATPTLSAAGGNGMGTYSYSSGNESIATVDASTGAITIIGSGAVTFTVTKAADTNYNESAASAIVTLTVLDKTDLTIHDTAATDPTLIAHLQNQGDITVGAVTRVSLTNEFTVAVTGTSTLASYASSNETQGTAKWIGLLIGNLKVNDAEASDITGLYCKTTAEGAYTQLTETDVTDASDVGGTSKELVFWIKTDVTPTKTIWLATSDSGANETKLTISFTAYTAPSADDKEENSSSGEEESSSPSTVPVVSTGDGTSTATVKPQINTSGNTTEASINKNKMENAIDAAVKAAAENKTVPAVEITAKVPIGATKIGFSIPKTALSVFADSKAETLSMISNIGTVSMNSKAVASIAKQAGTRDVIMSVAKVDTQQELNEQQRIAVAGAPVYDISITSGGNRISSFDGETISISLPYELKEGEDPASIVVWYLDGQGNVQKVQSAYDTATGTVIFTTNHLSVYFIGHDAAAVQNSPITNEPKIPDTGDDIHLFLMIMLIVISGSVLSIISTAVKIHNNTNFKK